MLTLFRKGNKSTDSPALPQSQQCGMFLEKIDFHVIHTIVYLQRNLLATSLWNLLKRAKVGMHLPTAFVVGVHKKTFCVYGLMILSNCTIIKNLGMNTRGISLIAYMTRILLS